jgi:hypothetical protein
VDYLISENNHSQKQHFIIRPTVVRGSKEFKTKLCFEKKIANLIKFDEVLIGIGCSIIS